MELLCVQKEYAVLRKLPGEECETQLPALVCEALGGEAYCVHRLDRAVGGVMVYARTKAAAAALGAQMQEHSFEKEYLAVVSGRPEANEGVLHDFLYKDPLKGRAFAVKSKRSGVKEAELSYKLLAAAPYEGGEASLVRVTLHTGRFHQIRCQFASRKMPLLGDGKYGSREKRCTVALMSCRIGFTDPQSGERVSFSAEPERVFPWDLFPEISATAP